jgi:ribonuclease HI
VAIYRDKRLVRQYKYRLQNHCSNNQAEHIAILKSLEQISSIADQTNRFVAIYTDSKVTLASLKNNTIHIFLIEEIRNKLRNLTKQNWSIHFGWVKAHTGIEGNEVTDALAKEAAQDDEERNIVYDRIPISTIATRVKEKGFKKWKTQWERTEKGALCRSFFPNGRAEAENTDPNNTGVYCHCQWPREDKNLFAQI